jgi:hypothetical protein
MPPPRGARPLAPWPGTVLRRPATIPVTAAVLTAAPVATLAVIGIEAHKFRGGLNGCGRIQLRTVPAGGKAGAIRVAPEDGAIALDVAAYDLRRRTPGE